MYRVPKKPSQYFSLSKLKLALAAVSSGAVLLAASPFAHAQQACSAGEIFVAAPVQDSSQATMTDSNGTPIATGCARPRSNPSNFQPLSGQPLQCPAGTYLVGTQVQDSSQGTAVDQDGNPYYMSCAQPQATYSTGYAAPAPAVSSSGTTSYGSSYRNSYYVGRSYSGGSSYSGSPSYSSGSSSYNGGGDSFNGGGSVSGGGSVGSGGDSGSGTASAPSSQAPGTPTPTGTPANSNDPAVSAALGDANKALGQIDRNNAQIAQDQKLLRDVPPNSLAARDIRDDIAARQRQNVQLEAKAKEDTDLATKLSKQNQANTLAASAQKANGQNALHSFNHFNTASLKGGAFGNALNAKGKFGSLDKRFNTAGLHGSAINGSRFGNLNGRFNTASLNRNSNGSFNSFQRHFNSGGLNRNTNGGFSTFKQRFNNASFRGNTAGNFSAFKQRVNRATFRGNTGSRFGSFVQRRTPNTGAMAFRSRPNFGLFNRARQQFHGFHSSGPRFASFGGGRGGFHGFGGDRRR